MIGKLVAQLVASVTIACALLVSLGASAAGVSRDDAAAAVLRVTGGRVLDIVAVTVDDRFVWRVKLLSRAGAVTVVLVDAADGRLL